MSGDIQRGDNVVAVHHNNCPNYARHERNRIALGVPVTIVVGRTYVVDGVAEVWDEIGLTLVGMPYGYCAGRFRKIDAADEQFTQQVRACKLIKTRVDA